MVTKEIVLNVLKDVYDPEIPINVVDMGLIYGVDIVDGNVHIRMTLTSPGCPMAGSIAEDVKQAVLKGTEAKKCEVEMVFEPRWTPDRMANDAKNEAKL
jgi:metal-sulfur cluster biosynthetic enzyme